MKEPKKSLGFVLVAACIVVSALFVVISSIRNLTALENTLLQVFSIALGLAGSFIVGKEGSKQDAVDMIKPHARSAFRRILSLYTSLSRLAAEIEFQKERLSTNKAAQNSLDKLQSIVIEQIGTADDAIEDWRDIIPEDIDKIRLTKERVLTIENDSNG